MLKLLSPESTKPAEAIEIMRKANQQVIYNNKANYMTMFRLNPFQESLKLIWQNLI